MEQRCEYFKETIIPGVRDVPVQSRTAHTCTRPSIKWWEKATLFFFLLSVCAIETLNGQRSLPISPSDSEADVALHLPVCGEAVPRDHRASGEGVQLPPQHLLLQQDRHRRQSEPRSVWSCVVSAVTKQATGSRCCRDSWWERERTHARRWHIRLFHK